MPAHGKNGDPRGSRAQSYATPRDSAAAWNAAPAERRRGESAGRVEWNQGSKNPALKADVPASRESRAYSEPARSSARANNSGHPWLHLILHRAAVNPREMRGGAHDSSAPVRAVQGAGSASLVDSQV